MTQDRAGRLADDLVGAAGRCELELHLQPEVDLETGHLAGAEALLRWYHPSEGLFWPADVIPLAAARGGMAQLTAWTLGTAAAAALRWPEANDTSRTCWVNVPGEGAEQTASVAVALVKRLEVPAGRLGLHVPATSLAFAPESSAQWIAECRAAGIAVHADALGASADPERLIKALEGQSRALSGLPLNGVVLSRDVTRHIVDRHVPAAVSAVANVARRSGWTVGAVGVESWDEADALTEHGVTRATGHLFGAAVRADRMRWLLTREGDSWRGSFAGDRKGALHVDHDVLAPTRRLANEPLVAPMPFIPVPRQTVETLVRSTV